MARILVVDDEPDIVRAVVRIMREHGHDVETAQDGLQALEHVAADVPDLVIIDLHLPRLDGAAVCARLKAETATRHIPVVMMTAGYIRLNEADRQAHPGPDEYLAKPFLKRTLLHNVDRLLS
ncbi:response regulator [Haliangium sp.]|uniref:response regulator n=1 Tax=Haliangium sp. TaxID=2663208 RepID=UPI003D153178